MSQDALRDLWSRTGLDPGALDRVRFVGPEELLPSVFPVTTAAAVTVGAATLAASELWRERTGRAAAVTVDRRHAAVAFRSERYLRVVGMSRSRPRESIWGYYRAGDGRWLQIHDSFPAHRRAALRTLGVAAERKAVAEALLGWSALEFEERVIGDGGCAAAMRSLEEWSAHPQGRAVSKLPPLEVLRIGEAPPEPLPPSDRPAENARVLDLTRVIAGPVCGRTLAAHGATVLRVGSEHLHVQEPLVIDTGFGKRFCHIDLRRVDGVDQLRALAKGADVFVQGYRPGALDARGLGPEALAELRPGIVYVSLSAFGHEGPWAARRGFDSIVQTASGICHAGAEAHGVEEPRPLPAQALDHGSGYLMAFGALVALARRAREGGSWLVRVSLAQTAQWLAGLPRIDGLEIPDPSREDVADLLIESDTPFGVTTHVRPAGSIEGAPPRWTLPPERPGQSPPVWA